MVIYAVYLTFKKKTATKSPQKCLKMFKNPDIEAWGKCVV